MEKMSRKNEFYNKVMGLLEDYHKTPADEWTPEEIEKSVDILTLCISECEDLERKARIQ